MPTQLQLRRGTTSQNNSFTGAAGELSVDTDLDQLRIHDGSTAGGTTVPASGQAVGFAGNTAPATNTVTLGTPANVVIRTATGQSGNVIIGDATATTSHSLDVRGTANTGAITATTITLSADGGVLLPNDGNIGSAGSTAAMQISSGGIVTFADDIKIKDGGTIGTASDADAITIASAGAVTFSQRDVHSSGITIADGGQIGSASDTDAIAIGADGDVTLTQDLELQHDGAILSFGADNEVTLTHSADSGLTLGVNHTGTGGVFVVDQAGTGDPSIQIKTAATSYMIGVDNSDSDTFKIDYGTTGVGAQTGISLNTSGNVTMAADLTLGDDLFLDSDSSVIHFGDDGDVTLTHVADTGLRLEDNDKLLFGTGADLEIYHDSSNSIIDDQGNGVLAIRSNGTGVHIQKSDGTAMGDFVNDGAVTLHHNGSARLATTSGGVQVTGNIVPASADGSTLGTTSLEFSDLFLADGATIKFGNDQDVTLTHVADTGLLLNSTMQLQFNDSSQFINAPSATVLDINATDEIELNATTIDVNGNLDVSGTIIDGAGGGVVPPGTVLPYTGSSAPTGYVLCDDSAISRTTFSVLFAIIGTSYGTGNGSTTFNVPDLRDRLPLGKGTNNSSLGAITAAAGASAVVATASGSASLTKSTGTFATSAKDSSTSTAVTNVTSGGHTHNLTLPAQVFNYIIKT